MSRLVVYDSLYGASRRYAQFIAQQSGAGLLERSQVQPGQLAECRELVYGAGIYAGSLTGGHWLAQQWPLLQGKRLLIFACGMLDPQAPGAKEQVRRQLARVLPEPMLEQAEIFPLRGAMDYSKMSGKHRGMMAGLRLFLLLKGKKRTPDEQAVLDSYGKTLDLVDLSSADRILQALEER